MIPVFKGTVENGALVIEPRFYSHLKKFEGKEVGVTVKKIQKLRSIPENSYFHGVVIPLFSDYTGYDFEESKEILKAKFLSYVDDKTGITRVKHTSELETPEFEEFMTNCRRWGDALGFYIPAPNEAEY